MQTHRLKDNFCGAQRPASVGSTRGNLKSAAARASLEGCFQQCQCPRTSVATPTQAWPWTARQPPATHASPERVSLDTPSLLGLLSALLAG
eukprot:1328353-Rhodomonas_salina.3